MNGSRLASSVLSRDSRRALFAVFEVSGRPVCNISNARYRSSHRLIERRELVFSSYDENAKRHATPLRCVFTDLNKCSTLSSAIYLPSACGEKRHGAFFCPRHGVLSSSARTRYFNRYDARHFSDEATKDPPVPYVQLDGIFKTLSESAPVEVTQNSLIWLHSATGLPWWATIVLATWSVRALVTLPLAFYQHYVLARYYNLKDELDVIVKELKQETNYAVYRYKWPEKYARAIYNRSFKKEKQKLIERDNCHPMKSVFLVLIQIPMWITISTALRNLSYVLPYHTESARAVYFELTTGGFAWVTNLAVPDNMYIIPVTLGVLNLAIIALQNLVRSSEPTKLQKYMANFFRLVSIGMIPLASYVPAATSLYWVSSSAFGLIQNFILVSPKVRDLVRIPPTDRDIEHPYVHMYTNLRRRLGLRDRIVTLIDAKRIVNTNKTVTK